MRIVSMVPSWTETLIECGAQVVGRTRFCLHPNDKISAIPAIGGTKDIDWQKLKELQPDLLVLDREENPKSMSELAPCAVFASDITGLQVMPEELGRLARVLDSSAPALPSDPRAAEGLLRLSERWRVLLGQPAPEYDWTTFPGVLTWLKEPPAAAVLTQTPVVYVIWKKPWLAVSDETFIGSALQKLGWRKDLIWTPRGVEGLPHTCGVKTSADRYPKFELTEVPRGACLMFSSEPFPFATAKSRTELKRDLASLEAFGCVVNGEAFSWFGLRSLRFLEGALGLGAQFRAR